MNILVTGASGFIGSHLVRRLVHLKHKIFISIRSNSKLDRIRDIVSKLVLVNTDSPEKIFKNNNINGVIHLATYYRKEDSDKKEMANMYESNVNFPTRLLNFAKGNGSTFFINTGTCFEYSPSIDSINEKSIIKPYNYYALTKVKFENRLIKSIQGSSLKAITLKLFFPYGEQDNDKLVKLLVENLIQRKKIHVTNGEQLLSYTYVDDIVNAYVLALKHIAIMHHDYDVFNIGGSSIKVSKIFDTIERISKIKGFIIRGKKYSKKEIMSMFTNSDKAKKELGWKQKWGLKEGLEKTINYFYNNENKKKKDYNAYFDKHL